MPKTSIFIDKVTFTHHPWIGLIDTNTNTKEEPICPSVSIKSALKLVLWLPEWKKKMEKFFLFLSRSYLMEALLSTEPVPRIFFYYFLLLFLFYILNTLNLSTKQQQKTFQLFLWIVDFWSCEET